MHPNRFGADHWQRQRIAKLPRLHIKVVNHFHMVGDETDGHDEEGDVPEGCRRQKKRRRQLDQPGDRPTDH